MECQQLISLGAVQTTLRWESMDGLLDGKGSAAGGNSDLSPLRVEKVSGQIKSNKYQLYIDLRFPNRSNI